MKLILTSTTTQLKKLLVIGVTCLFIMALATSCHYDEVLPREIEIPVEPISYSLNIQPFFDAKCVSCHAGSVPPDLSASVSYNELISGNYIDTANPENSSLYESIDNGGSMEIYATAEERAILLAWIEQGAMNN